MILRPQIPEPMEPWLQPKRYKIAKGGRGGGKSMTIAQILVSLAATKKLRILCAREIQKSIKESVHYMLAEAIEALGLQAFYDVGQSYIKSITGSEFIFTGLRHNIDSIKSMGGINIVWIEEADKTSPETWLKLDPTIRAKGSEIWFSYNPEDEDSIVHKLALNPYPNMLVVEINFEDNPFFPEELEVQRLRMLADPDARDDYEHVWLGKTKKNLHAQIFRNKWAVEYFESASDWFGPYFGCDWGYSNDPTVLIKCWIYNEILYIEKCISQVGLELDDTPGRFHRAMPEARDFVIRADSASPSNISYVKRNGHPRMIGAKKPKNSIIDGIIRMRAFKKIVIMPGLDDDVIMNFRLYSWKTDKLTHEVLNEPVDKYNDCIDAIRYALEPILLKKKTKRTGSHNQSIMER